MRKIDKKSHLVIEVAFDSINCMRMIAHLDMDAFFASVEEKNTPRFKGLPLVVGSDPKNGIGRGVVSTASYKAREYGIHSAMPITRAWRISQLMKNQGKPEVVFLPVDFELYERASDAVEQIIRKYADLVEQASIDEFYFDLSGEKTFKKVKMVCEKIKKEIKLKEDLTCSIGLGPNKLISKIAAGEDKPDGLTFVMPKDAEKFLEPLAIRKIPGIGPKTAQLLGQFNVKNVNDLKKFSKEQLSGLLHKWGEELYYKVRGIDDSPIIEEREVKSIGEQITFQQDTLGAVFIGQELNKMCESVFSSFKESGFDRFKTIAITVRFSDFFTRTSAKSFKEGFGKDNLNKLKIEALRLVLPYLDKRKNPQLKNIRLIGIRVENFI